ncbi:MAG: hypothetical protein A2428_15530 [Bdellovibrionales bacterium RIFOXYC1_FULL_54_43]|nr:MAG: hypothetical protein A2428_15530 [Bdellovibrionales bacterium RIFOXYC1_FULL_54_43]OFZ84778.1 MAG: hypothetical protein A2603_05350 [Bdellovibrionales bacterium RIFOXYD1_FULL_55_31]
MSTVVALDPTSLLGIGRALLLLSFGIALLIHQRNGDLRVPFERIAIGFLGLMFFIPIVSGLDQLSGLLADWIAKKGDPDGVKQVLSQAYEKAAAITDAEGGKAAVPEILLQIWRTGVWAVVKSLSELLFLVVAVMLENARAIFWKVLSFLAPLSIGFFPIFPKFMFNSVLFFFELALWIPVLRLIQVAAFPLARAAHEATGGVGVGIVAIEALCILLYLSIPTFTHRFVSGALSGELDPSHKAVSFAVQKATMAAGIVKGRIIG